jgi:hypothetical protein
MISSYTSLFASRRSSRFGEFDKITFNIRFWLPAQNRCQKLNFFRQVHRPQSFIVVRNFELAACEHVANFMNSKCCSISLCQPAREHISQPPLLRTLSACREICYEFVQLSEGTVVLGREMTRFSFSTITRANQKTANAFLRAVNVSPNHTEE